LDATFGLFPMTSDPSTVDVYLRGLSLTFGSGDERKDGEENPQRKFTPTSHADMNSCY
jgi:hypothetical protein